MSKKLIIRIDRLEIKANAVPEFRATQEKELAWQDWRTQSDCLGFKEFRELFITPLPDPEYEKVMTPEEDTNPLCGALINCLTGNTKRMLPCWRS